jgi:Zn-dependent protease with chaperone function
MPEENWGSVAVVDDRYAPMIARLERVAERNSSAYRLRVLAAGLLGYLVVGGLLSLVTVPLALISAFLATASQPLTDAARYTITGALVVLVLFFAFRLPCTRLPGFIVRPGELAGLFEVIEAVRQRMAAPHLHEVRIYAGINAGVMEEQRLGRFARRNVLRVGLPLLYALSEAEFEALLAHEFGHLTNRHNGSLQFVSRLRQRWLQLGARLPTGWAAWLLRRFFAWYGPWFVAYSQVLFRRHEFEADMAAAQVVGPDVLASALRRVAIKAFRFDEITSSEADLVRRGAGSVEVWRWALRNISVDYLNDHSILAYQMSYREGPSDSHPSLARRLAALGSEATGVLSGVPAAKRLLGSSADSLVERLVAD